MLDFILFLFVGVGITNIVVNASILDYPRDIVISKSPLLEKLLTCMLCTGFWIGLCLWTIHPAIFAVYGKIAPLCAGAVISLASSFYDILTDYLLFSDEVIDEIKD